LFSWYLSPFLIINNIIFTREREGVDQGNGIQKSCEPFCMVPKNYIAQVTMVIMDKEDFSWTEVSPYR
jgi:hypothetical protein